ncbi:MAG: serine hydrolase [Gemmatimonadota bacterium]
MGEQTEDDLVETLLRQRPEWFGRVLERPDHYEVQVLYTQIDRDEANRPVLHPHPYRVDGERYFYPASTVKLAGAILTLEKLNQLAVPGLDRHTPLRIDCAGEGQVAVLHDLSSPTGRPSLGHYIVKLFAASDNEAYNRLYEFVGQERLNRGLRDRGYRDARLTHRLSVALGPEQNRRTNPMAFYRGAQVLYRQPAATGAHDYRHPEPIPRGRGVVESGIFRPEPLDFSGKNHLSVQVLQDLVAAVLFPEALPPQRRFGLRPQDYDFLRRCMAILPRECRYPRCDPERYHDSYGKFLLCGDRRDPMPDHIRIFNKAGIAYGYLVDTAYVADLERRVEFLLTAVIQVNEDGVYNRDVMTDEAYAYQAVGFPFLANLGRAIYEHELERPRPRAPDLSAFETYRHPAAGMDWG